LKEVTIMDSAAISNYRRETWQALESNDDPNHGLNAARKEVGLRDPVNLKGKDASYRDVKEEQQNIGHAVTEAAIHLAPDVIAEGATHVAAHFLKGVALGCTAGAIALIGGAAGLYIGLNGIDDANQKGKAQAHALDRDAARTALLMCIKIPSGYQQAEFAKTPQVISKEHFYNSPVSKLATAIQTNEALSALMQLSADRGMTAACKLLDAGVIAEGTSAADILAALPAEAREPFEKNAAFRAGFESMVWAKAHDPAAYTQSKNELAEHNRIYTAHLGHFRG
jgi:hypothetical protein